MIHYYGRMGGTMKTKIVKKDNIEVLVKALNNGEIIAFPTETVYGLGVVYDSYEAVEKLKKAKQRPENKPFTLMVSSKEMIYQFAEINQQAQIILDAFMPGALTLIFNKLKHVEPYITNGFSTIGIRFPNDPFVIELISAVGKPLLVPSANISGRFPALTHQEVLEQLEGVISYVVEGKCTSEVASTIIDVTKDKIQLLRQGEITLDKIKEKLNGNSNSM